MTGTKPLQVHQSAQYAAIYYSRNWAARLISEGHDVAAAELLAAAWDQAGLELYVERRRRKIEMIDDASLKFLLDYGVFVRDKKRSGLQDMLTDLDARLYEYRQLVKCEK